jgi:hypothetical protein
VVANLVLGPLLRHVGPTTATIWVETDAACAVEVLGHRTRTFCVGGHHYALVTVEHLEPGTTTAYEVHLDGEGCWPPVDSDLPPSVIRTIGDGSVRILFGSCRAAAPHEPPWTLELDHDDVGRGVDALYAHGLRMLEQPPEEWPHLLLFAGDQIYADDSSPTTRARVERRRGHLADDPSTPPLDDVADFEEYTWLYHEAWSPPIERWVLSVVPSAMIFDDHDVIDDWNTSASWVHDIRRVPWWQERVTGGMMSYWVYQHLGNLAPAQIGDEGMLDRFVEIGDATDELRAWAEAAEAFTPEPGRYRFSFHRDLGSVRMIVIDSRNARVLEPGHRRMVHDEEWAWVTEQAVAECDHLVLATSVPVAMPGGLHDLERWNELVAEGAWGKWSRPAAEFIRRAVDLEDWAAFHQSYLDMMSLLRQVGTAGDHRSGPPPSTVTVLSGDVHFSFLSRAEFPDVEDHLPVTSRVHQIVNSPIRNVLTTRERRVMRLGLGRAGEWIARGLRRAAGGRADDVEWIVTEGPYFANHMCTLELGDDVRMVLERAHPDDDGRPLLSVAADASLVTSDPPTRRSLPRPPRRRRGSRRHRPSL